MYDNNTAIEQESEWKRYNDAWFNYWYCPECKYRSWWKMAQCPQCKLKMRNGDGKHE